MPIIKNAFDLRNSNYQFILQGVTLTNNQQNNGQFREEDKSKWCVIINISLHLHKLLQPYILHTKHYIGCSLILTNN